MNPTIGREDDEHQYIEKSKLDIGPPVQPANVLYVLPEPDQRPTAFRMHLSSAAVSMDHHSGIMHGYHFVKIKTKIACKLAKLCYLKDPIAMHNIRCNRVKKTNRNNVPMQDIKVQSPGQIMCDSFWCCPHPPRRSPSSWMSLYVMKAKISFLFCLVSVNSPSHIVDQNSPQRCCSFASKKSIRLAQASSWKPLPVRALSSWATVDQMPCSDCS